MATSTVDAIGDPILPSAVLMASSKHISTKCLQENVEFVKWKRRDPNPEKCLEKGQEFTRLKTLRQTCTKEMDGYAQCMHYYTNELCREEQQAFENACPLK